MARVAYGVRFVGADLDFATWHAHLATRSMPARALFQQPRREIEPAAEVERRWVEPLDLASWRARLRGAERRAA
ncbi:MAG TPA: hypothetical protein VH482_09210 [Thermomicrobiales bacterium]